MKVPTLESDLILGPGGVYAPTDKTELINQYIFEINNYAKADHIAQHTGWIGRQFWFVRDQIEKRLTDKTVLGRFDETYFGYHRSPFQSFFGWRYGLARKRLQEVMK